MSLKVVYLRIYENNFQNFLNMSFNWSLNWTFAVVFFFSLSGFMTFFVLFFQTCTGYDRLLEAENLLRRQTTILEPLVRIGHDNHFIRAQCVHIPLHVPFRNPSFLPK